LCVNIKSCLVRYQEIPIQPSCDSNWQPLT